MLLTSQYSGTLVSNNVTLVHATCYFKPSIKLFGDRTVSQDQVVLDLIGNTARFVYNFNKSFLLPDDSPTLNMFTI